MSNQPDYFAALLARIAAVNGEPAVLEALWDGDTDGWHLCLTLYYYGKIWWFKELPSPVLSKVSLGVVSLGGDIRLFAGQVPPWPEAELAKELGRRAQAQYGLTCYFPSEEPDNDCPAWPQRHLAIACGDCGKLVIPNGSPYLPQDICYPCHLKREHAT